MKNTRPTVNAAIVRIAAMIFSASGVRLVGDDIALSYTIRGASHDLVQVAYRAAALLGISRYATVVSNSGDLGALDSGRGPGSRRRQGRPHRQVPGESHHRRKDVACFDRDATGPPSLSTVPHALDWPWRSARLRSHGVPPRRAAHSGAVRRPRISRSQDRHDAAHQS